MLKVKFPSPSCILISILDVPEFSASQRFSSSSVRFNEIGRKTHKMADSTSQKPIVAFLGPPSSFTHQVRAVLHNTTQDTQDAYG